MATCGKNCNATKRSKRRARITASKSVQAAGKAPQAAMPSLDDIEGAAESIADTIGDLLKPRPSAPPPNAPSGRPAVIPGVDIEVIRNPAAGLGDIGKGPGGPLDHNLEQYAPDRTAMYLVGGGLALAIAAALASKKLKGKR